MARSKSTAPAIAEAPADPVQALARVMFDCADETAMLDLVVNIDDADLLEAAGKLADEEGLDRPLGLIVADRVALIRREGAPPLTEVVGTVSRMLPCVLTEEEKHAAAGRVVELTDAIETVTIEAKSAADTYKARKQLLEGERSAEATKWRTGKAARTVTCEWVYDIAGETVRLVRTDTGEVLETRAPTDKERQRPLFPNAAAEADDEGEDE